jgi:hypothetical protein
MANTGQSDRRKGNRRQGSRRKGDIRIIRSEGDKQQEVTVRHEAVSQGKERSILGWHEEFAIAWSETFITRKAKEIQEKENDYEHLCRELITICNRGNYSASF